MLHGDLLTQVRRELLPLLQPLGFEVVQSEESESFDNASTVLQSPDFRIRVVRERGVSFADFGPLAEPGTWFDSAVVLDYLGLSESAGFHERDLSTMLRGLGGFIVAFVDDMRAQFQEQDLARRKGALTALKEARTARLFDDE